MQELELPSAVARSEIQESKRARERESERARERESERAREQESEREREREEFSKVSSCLKLSMYNSL